MSDVVGRRQGVTRVDRPVPWAEGLPWAAIWLSFVMVAIAVILGWLWLVAGPDAPFGSLIS